MTTADTERKWTLIEGADAGEQDARPGKPIVTRMSEHMDRATGVLLTFRAGDVMADHQAGSPILIVGMSGELTVTVGADAVSISPGQTMHIAARTIHRLHATNPASAALIVLTGP